MGNPLHYSCLKNPMDRGGWWATVHRVTQHAHPKQMSCCYLREDQTEREKNKAKMRINSYKLINVFLCLYLTHEFMFSHSGLSNSLQPHRLQLARLLSPGDYPSKTTAAGSHFLLWEIFPTQGQTPHLLQLLPWQVDSLALSHLRSPKKSKSHRN